MALILKTGLAPGQVSADSAMYVATANDSCDPATAGDAGR